MLTGIFGKILNSNWKIIFYAAVGNSCYNVTKLLRTKIRSVRASNVSFVEIHFCEAHATEPLSFGGAGAIRRRGFGSAPDTVITMGRFSNI
jgi:hypothetical protein